MKTCIGCKYAEWRKRANGTLHHSGSGVCNATPENKIPNAFKVKMGGLSICGGRINRETVFKTDCPFYEE